MAESSSEQKKSGLIQGVNPDQLGWGAFVGMGILFVILLGGACFLLLWSRAAQIDEIRLTLLAILCVLALLLALATVSLSFAKFGLCDPKQALGLPEGSVRAVIAMSLIVILVMLSVVYFYGLSPGQILKYVSDEEKQRLVTDPRMNVVKVEPMDPPLNDASAKPTWDMVFSVEPNKTIKDLSQDNATAVKDGFKPLEANSQASPNVNKNEAATNPVFTVTFNEYGRVQLRNLNAESKDQIAQSARNAQITPTATLHDVPKWAVTISVPPSKESADFAKTLLTGLITLVTSVVSFYFGTSTVISQAQKTTPSAENPGLPTFTNVDPPESPSTPQPLHFTLLGTGLDQVRVLKLVKGNTEIPCAVSESAKASLKFTVSGLSSGDWTVTGKDGNGSVVSLKTPLKIT